MKKILLIDDEDVLRDLMRDILEDEGYSVIEAENGFAAFEIMKNNQDIDGILLDLLMPKMSGFELVEKMREEGILEGVPILVITASVNDESEEQINRHKINDFLVKPYNNDEVIEKLSGLLVEHA